MAGKTVVGALLLLAWSGTSFLYMSSTTRWDESMASVLTISSERLKPQGQRRPAPHPKPAAQ